jgi:hypothetical protein
MKKAIIFSVFFVSCAVSHGVPGDYYNNGADYKKSLLLNKDGTFALNIELFDGKSECHGKWEYLSKDTILLKCDSEAFPGVITSGYMSERQQKVVLLDDDKIKYKQTILTKSTKKDSSKILK